MGKAGSFGGDALEDVVHERVHDAHGFAGDTSVRVNLLQHLVDVDSIAFLSLSPPLLLFSCSLCLSGSLLAFLSCNFGCHVCTYVDQNGFEMPEDSMQLIFTVKQSKDRLAYGSKITFFDWLLNRSIEQPFQCLL